MENIQRDFFANFSPKVWKNLNFLRPLHESIINYLRCLVQISANLNKKCDPWYNYSDIWEDEFFNFWLFFAQKWSKFSKLYVSGTWHDIANLIGSHILGVFRFSVHVFLTLDNSRADFTQNLGEPSILKLQCKTSNWHYWWVGWFEKESLDVML